jgi:hypothetical protein
MLTDSSPEYTRLQLIRARKTVNRALRSALEHDQGELYLLIEPLSPYLHKLIEKASGGSLPKSASPRRCA